MSEQQIMDLLDEIEQLKSRLYDVNNEKNELVDKIELREVKIEELQSYIWDLQVNRLNE